MLRFGEGDVDGLPLQKRQLAERHLGTDLSY
jgi:hypothetical protein